MSYTEPSSGEVKKASVFVATWGSSNYTYAEAFPFHQGDRRFVAPNEPNGLVINYYLKNKTDAKVRVVISDPYGNEVGDQRFTQRALVRPMPHSHR